MLGRKLSTDKFESWLYTQSCSREVDEIILHHTWRPTAKQYKGKSTIEAIRDYHVNNQGWSDIGYHFLIAPNGDIWAGRHIEQAGAHTRGRNARSVGVCLIGDLDEEDLTEEQKASLVTVLRALLKRFRLPIGAINFHRDYAPYKSCPGMKLDKGVVRSWVSSSEPSETASSEKNADDAETHPDVPPWAVDAVKWALESGVIKGMPRGKVEGYRFATRAEVVVMLHRLWKLLQRE